MGAMPPHPRDGTTLLAHLGGAHTHHHNHIRRCRHRIRRYRITVWVRFGCCMVVCTSSSACRVTMGHWGQGHHIPGMARHCLATFGGPHTHCIRPLVRIAQRRSGVVRWRVRHPQQLGPQWGIALPNCTAKATHLRIAGHCLATLGGHTHTSKTTFGVANTVFVTVRIVQRRVRASNGRVHVIL